MRWSRHLIVVSLLVLLVAFWQRDTLPASIDFVPGIDAAPLQTPTRRAPFVASWDDTDYQIEPQFDYELTGLVVSYRQHDGQSRMHKLTSDHLNAADLCVVWGDTARAPTLDEIEFWNGIFTCNFSTKDTAAWRAFNGHEVSNNHLIATDSYVRDRIADVRIGDQVRIRGSLAEYITPTGSRRGTSITREDTGNGACETIYVDDFEIVQAGFSGWRTTMWVALIALLLSLVGYLLAPHARHTR